MSKKIWKGKGTLTDEQAALYGQRCEDLAARLKKPGATPEDVVDDAKKKNAPYHDYFEWDDSVAGHEYRLNQARVMLRSIEVEVVLESGDIQKTRAFHCIVVNGDEKEYVSQSQVFSNAEWSAQIVEKAMNEARAWCQRYRQYSALAGVCNTLEEMLDDIDDEE